MRLLVESVPVLLFVRIQQRFGAPLSDRVNSSLSQPIHVELPLVARFNVSFIPYLQYPIRVHMLR